MQGRIELVSEFQGKTAKDVQERMEVVMEARGEGLILKHPDGEYVLNGRNKDWIKVRNVSLLAGSTINPFVFNRRLNRSIWLAPLRLGGLNGG